MEVMICSAQCLKEAESGDRSESPDLSLEGVPGPLIRCTSHMDEGVEKRRPLFYGHIRQKESPKGYTRHSWSSIPILAVRQIPSNSTGRTE